MPDLNMFKMNFERWILQLEAEGDTGAEEIREQVRKDWGNHELRELWVRFVDRKVNG